jgi:phosphoribosylaminoimidazolecarboxamide formyltransferase/IMP cyclohydrolase
MKSIELKYGCNPNQKPAEIRSASGELPLKVLSGKPGYINFMDAVNSWQLVKELKAALNMPAAASFKHVSPAGAAIGPDVATAYMRARAADRLSSFGDWAAISDVVDKAAAEVIGGEVSDGLIAPGYTPEALEILLQKRGGNYNVIEIDPKYEPPEVETRFIYGIEFVQKRNSVIPSFENLKNIVTADKNLPIEAQRDMILAMLTLKYSQSNSVCYVKDGQVIGVGAGQQSRIHCTRLAGDKADIWYLKQHPTVLGMKFKEGVGKAEKDNAIDLFVRTDTTEYELKILKEVLEVVPDRFTAQEREAWLAGLKNVTLGSDAFFPFRDNIDRAQQSGVKYVVQTGGSLRDDIVIEACDEYKMVMAVTGLRLFHH